MPPDESVPPDEPTRDEAAGARFELIARHAPVAIVEVARDGTIVDANPRWLTLTDARIGADWLEAVAPPDRVAAEAHLRDALRARATTTLDFRLDRDARRPLWLRATLIPIGAERPTHVLCAAIDVTREREIDAQAQRLLAQRDEARMTLDRIVEATDCFPYSFQVEVDGRVRPLPDGHAHGRTIAGFGPEITDWRDVIEDDDRPTYVAFIAGLPDGDRYAIEYRIVLGDGSTRWVSDTGYARHRSDGGVLLDGAMRDVTQIRRMQDEQEDSVAWANEANAQLEYMNVELESARAEAEAMARTDALTGLANRRHFTESLADALAVGRVGLVMLDVDRFKQINDRHGHASGDAVLVEVARRLRATLGEADAIARIGGEEFVALFASASEAAAAAAGERMRLVLRSTPVETDEGPITVTASFGAAELEFGSPDEVLSAADRALYAAKHRGRDRVVRASEAPLEQEGDEQGWSQALRIARAVVVLALGGDRAEEGQADIAELAAQTALELGAPNADILRCRLAGWLHDIGNGALPQGILGKAGPLDDEEWARVREHPVRAERLVRDVPAIADAAAGVRHHHERWDGGGYPDGLAGEAIPFEARVIAVADSWGAMTDWRPYREPLSHDAALAELRSCAGTQFDPHVVEAFARVVDRGAARAA